MLLERGNVESNEQNIQYLLGANQNQEAQETKYNLGIFETSSSDIRVHWEREILALIAAIHSQLSCLFCWRDFVSMRLKFEQRLLIQLKRIIDRPAGRRRCRNYTSADFGAFPPHPILGPRPPVIPCASVFVCDCPCLSILSTYRCFTFSRLNSVFLLCITLKVM